MSLYRARFVGCMYTRCVGIYGRAFVCCKTKMCTLQTLYCCSRLLLRPRQAGRVLRSTGLEGAPCGTLRTPTSIPIYQTTCCCPAAMRPVPKLLWAILLAAWRLCFAKYTCCINIRINLLQNNKPSAFDIRPNYVPVLLDSIRHTNYTTAYLYYVTICIFVFLSGYLVGCI